MSLILHSFANIEKREKETYLDVLRQYKKGNELRRGHVEFIKIALKYMDEFGVNHDLAVYKALLDVLPKGKFVPFNWYQTITLHYPLQQKVAIELLEKMEYNCVIPDYEMQQMLINIFGVHARVLKKFWRMMYWMPKFANLNPWPCPRPTPRDPRILAKLAIYKISSVDPATHITEYEIKKDIENAVENTWIISAMSISQKELLAKHPLNSPIFVEGPYLVWVANQCIDYFLLRADATTQKKRPYEDIDGKQMIINQVIK
jgi:signaling intermediate in Toll pathway protein